MSNEDTEGGGFFVKQVVAVAAVMAFSFVVSYVIARVLDATMGLRADERQEKASIGRRGPQR